VSFRSNGNGLFMEVTNIAESSASPQGVIEVHGAAARKHEDMLHVPLGDEAHHVIGELCG
jgi:hypothetical protein